jgi:hypothetical protein
LITPGTVKERLEPFVATLFGVMRAPAKFTVFWEALMKNPEPLIVTFVPTGPDTGESEVIEGVPSTTP